MSASVLYMSMSLDRYIAGSNDEPDNPGGDGVGRLQSGASLRTAGLPDGRAGADLIDEINATGAVLTGRRTAEQVDRWGGDHRSWCPDLRGQSSAARPVRRELSVGDVRDRWDRERDGTGEGRRR